MTNSSRPRGDLVAWEPVRRPVRSIHEGTVSSVVPLSAAVERDLYESSRGPQVGEELWDYLPYGPFASRTAFGRWLSNATASDDPLFFAILERHSQAARGVASYMRIDPANGVIEIGHVWLSPTIQRSRVATEAIYLLMRHAFEDLGYRRLEWKCDSLNAASRRAAERYGFTFEGVFRQAVVVKGRNRDTAWYSITDREWPSRRRALIAWLAADNFDEAGRQRRRLAEIRALAPSAEDG